MLAFHAKGLGLEDLQPFWLPLDWNGRAVFPVDLMGIKEKLFRPGLGVIKDGHFSITHHDKFLFLKRVKPGNKDMGLEPGGEFHVRRRNVGDLFV